MFKLVVRIEIKINNSCSTWFHSCESLTSKLYWIKNTMQWSIKNVGNEARLRMFTVDAIEVLIKYCTNSFPQVDQFI